jgi:hypothetical protein
MRISESSTIRIRVTSLREPSVTSSLRFRVSWKPPLLTASSTNWNLLSLQARDQASGTQWHTTILKRSPTVAMVTWHVTLIICTKKTSSYWRSSEYVKSKGSLGSHLNPFIIAQEMSEVLTHICIRLYSCEDSIELGNYRKNRPLPASSKSLPIRLHGHNPCIEVLQI